MKTYSVTTNNAQNLDDFMYILVRDCDDLIMYSNRNADLVRKYARMIELEHFFADDEVVINYYI